MLPRADNVGVRPVAYVEAPAPVTKSGDARQEVYHRLNQISIGQHVPAKVLERMTDGTFLVRLADTSAKMSLPVGTKVGDDLDMTLLERQPRPTFLLGTANAGKSGDAPATLSSAGRLIDHLLQAFQQNGNSAALVGRVPVLPSPVAGSPQVAAALQDAVDVSGLFYESHLAQWVAGSRPLASLLREPQAQQMAALPDPDGNSSTEPSLLRQLFQQWSSSDQSLADLMQQSMQKHGADQAAQNINSQSAQMINAQLNALELQRFAWQGELWPGQKMEWEVSRDDKEGENGQPEQESWQSAVKFELPTLGDVSATIHLVGERVSIFIRTGSDESAALLRAHGGQLADALGAAGSPLEALTVNHDGKT